MFNCSFLLVQAHDCVWLDKPTAVLAALEVGPLCPVLRTLVLLVTYRPILLTVFSKPLELEIRAIFFFFFFVPLFEKFNGTPPLPVSPVNHFTEYG